MSTDSTLMPTRGLQTSTPSPRAIARLVGVLLIVATIASLTGSALINPVVKGADYLREVDAAQARVLTGVMFLIIAAFASASIAMALYPVLRRYSRGLSLGAVGMRLIEASMYLVAALGPVLLVILSEQHVRAATATPVDETLGTLLKGLRDQAGAIGALAFYLGGAMYYVIFYRTRLIPRWLSEWGLIGVALGFVAGCLVVMGVMSFGAPVMLALNLPIFAQEMVLAGWLLVVGFRLPQPD